MLLFEWIPPIFPLWFWHQWAAQRRFLFVQQTKQTAGRGGKNKEKETSSNFAIHQSNLDWTLFLKSQWRHHPMQCKEGKSRKKIEGEGKGRRSGRGRERLFDDFTLGDRKHMTSAFFTCFRAVRSTGRQSDLFVVVLSKLNLGDHYIEGSIPLMSSRRPWLKFFFLLKCESNPFESQCERFVKMCVLEPTAEIYCLISSAAVSLRTGIG